uniref:Estradiol 17-beta-dehydrogenase 12 n=1 Tax=Heterorhabditis bacteriophora TaxID=37862 RepID=A0A1I7WI61_HETBA
MERIFSTVEIYALWIYQFRGLVPNQFCSYWLWITTLVCIIAGILYRYFKNPYNYIDFDLEADLTGKVFAVTGASSGIGAEITRELYKRNAVVLMLVKEWKKGVKVTLTTSMITYINKEVAYIKKKDVKLVYCFVVNHFGFLRIVIVFWYFQHDSKVKNIGIHRIQKHIPLLWQGVSFRVKEARFALQYEDLEPLKSNYMH